MAGKTGGRWYDKYPPLGDQLDLLRDMNKPDRGKILRKLRDLIAEREPGLVDRTVLEYPMTYKRRWYDADPLTWLTINGLSYCKNDCISAAISFLKQELGNA